MTGFLDSSLIETASTGFQLQRSLRLRATATAYLNRTFGTPTDNNIWSWSGWCKRGVIGSGVTQMLFCGDANDAGFNMTLVRFTADKIEVLQVSGGTTTLSAQTNAVYRDPSAWYHIVVVYNSDEITATNRLRIYVNGALQSLTYAAGPVGSGVASQLNVSGRSHQIGRLLYANTQFLDGYLTDINFIDGQTLTPSAFGQFDSNGMWQPKAYTGTYGTNGFELDFSNPTSTTTLMLDRSGNGNNWTSNNISLTPGVTYDSMLDVPLGSGGSERGNYCTISPFQMAVSGPIFTLSSGNLNYSCPASTGNAGRMYARGTHQLPVEQIYWEVRATSTNLYSGICNEASLTDAGIPGSFKSISLANTTQGSSNTTAVYSGTTFTFVANDILGFAWNGFAQTLGCYRNGTLIGTFSNIESTNPWFPQCGINSSAASTSAEWNFGQRPFAHTPPTGFKPLQTGNLPAPAIANPKLHFDAVTRVGTGVAGSVSTLAFQPDLVWFKNRSVAYSHNLSNSISGATKYLVSSSTTSELTDATALTAFNSNGYSFGALVDINGNGNAIVDWSWKAGGAAVTNTAGSISAQVSANPSAGFSVVSWTGTGANATIGHGLGKSPSLIINKTRNATDNWPIYHSGMTSLEYVYLNLTNAKTSLAAMWNSTPPSSTVFSVGTNANINTNAQTMISYCFAEITGYSRISSYTGNGNVDGTFVFCGFRPEYVMVKRTNAAGSWVILDSARELENPEDRALYANLSDAETLLSNGGIDFTSNGFKLRSTDANINASGSTYIFIAIAEAPFKSALAR